MNMLSPARPHLVIEIVHDLVCPWCYLGLRRLRRSLAARPEIEVSFLWRAFLLNPDMPRVGMPREAYVTRKFGSEERAHRLFASIGQVGLAEGIAFRFDRAARMPSSVDAHRLVRFAGRAGRELDLVEALFAAYFSDGIDIGDPARLVMIAAQNGLDAEAAAQFLASDAEIDAVHADNLRAHRLGINGVPCFIFSGRHAIAGAQEPAVISRLIDVALLEESDAF
ncbi:MAG: DsbA family oxidoreductase [Acidibrevibacterium sp.]|jgi:predicted DsbA family dithiol-disulfide isomerase|uniref:DsbA family oxidoreductase n=1 Tax=Acidibrevibacterium fodinaquatile TaxID=1969806 RepID=UPI0023A7AAAE|nr:DsbA family oxidoreductase [Acidibrevibacterium fodinaquatile]MCA7117972.1 DsbA family oxidoreductase [Acidibrevibacterium fodinaquatile]